MPRAFAQCATCHSMDPATRRSGPTLAGVLDRGAGTLPGYPYSAVMKDSGIVWTDETLDQFLANPQRMMSGNRMVASVPNPDARRQIIEFLSEP